MMKRKSNVLITLMGIAVVCSLAMSASAQHSPLSDWAQCPENARSLAARFAPLPTFDTLTVGGPINSWPDVGTYDFCGYMDTLYCQLKPLGSLLPEVILYADLLRCLDADINGQVYEQPPAVVSVSITVNSSGQCTVYWNGQLTHDNIAIPGWSPQADWYMGFGARTGGLHDYHIVDDFDLNSAAMNYTEMFSAGAGSGTLYGNAAIASAQLMLTDKLAGQTGSWSFLPSAAATEFTVSYLQYIGDGDGADGMCFFYGPGANSAFGETGPLDTTGLRLSFHTHSPDNTIDLVYNGTSLSANNTVGELRQTEDWLPVSGNGMTDGQYEFALLGHVLNTPTHPLHADAHAAIQVNFTYFKNLIQLALTDIDGTNYLAMVPLMVPWLIGALAMQLAGYATLDDPQTYAALDAVLGLLEQIGLSAPPGGVISVTDGIGDVGPIADFEGDTFTNIDEHNYLVETGNLSLSNYLAYVMNAPTGSITGAKYYMVGTTITLRPALAYGGVIEGASWDKEGTPLGSTNPLVIPNCLYTDAGEYGVIISHRMGDAKTTAQTTGSGTVTVGDTPIPVTGLAGLAALSGAIALMAARRMRRRK